MPDSFDQVREARLAENDYKAQAEALKNALRNLVAEGCAPMRGDFKCDECAIEMKPEFFVALMAGKILLARLDKP